MYVESYVNQTARRRVHFRARDFIVDHFGTPPQVRAALAAIGVEPPSLFTIHKWTTRDSVPGLWLAALVASLENQAKRPKLSAYLVKDGHDDIFD